MITVIDAIASKLEARTNCLHSGSKEWRERHTEKLEALTRIHTETLESLVKNYLPSGSGFDDGVTLDLEGSTVDRVVFHTSFHHMNDNGYYDGWTEHTITVTPSFTGINIEVTGKNRNDIKDYIVGAFYEALTTKEVGQ